MDRPILIELAGNLGIWDLPYIVGLLSPAFQACSENRAPTVTVNLKRLDFVSASALAVLTSSLLRTVRDGAQLSINPPRDDDCQMYLTRVNFYDRLKVSVPYPWTQRDPTGRFLELVEADSEENCHKVARALAEIFSTQGALDLEAYFGILTTLSEIIENVFHHAGGGVRPIAAAQSYPNRNRVEFAIADTGVGFESSLGRNPHWKSQFASAPEAIRLALRRRVTGTPDRNSGEGLFFAAELCRANGGDMRIYSGSGLVTVGQQETAMSAPEWRGAVVAFSLRTNGQLDLTPIYERYAPASGDFELLPEDDDEAIPF